MYLLGTGGGKLGEKGSGRLQKAGEERVRSNISVKAGRKGQIFN